MQVVDLIRTFARGFPLRIFFLFLSLGFLLETGEGFGQWEVWDVESDKQGDKMTRTSQGKI